MMHLNVLERMLYQGYICNHNALLLACRKDALTYIDNNEVHSDVLAIMPHSDVLAVMIH